MLLKFNIVVLKELCFRFQVILPKTWPGKFKPMCLHLAGTGDHVCIDSFAHIHVLLTVHQNIIHGKCSHIYQWLFSFLIFCKIFKPSFHILLNYFSVLWKKTDATGKTLAQGGWHRLHIVRKSVLDPF